mmetsp:Transcript_19816/g.32490  ORF Transcript_19816/g.32490 Transcript_19816/m.32490 type:complete len:362 (-) Transcript_19816:40-1125(-)
MCHRAFLLSQTTRRLAADAASSGRHRHFNLIMTKLGQNTKQSCYRHLTTQSKKGAETAAAETTPEPPTARQLVSHAIKCAIPMIGFGFMDNTIMIHAGHYIDCTLGVKFSLSTLAAAGIGQIFSGIGGVMFGDTLEAVFREASGGTVHKHKLSTAQKLMRSSRIAGVVGGIIGVSVGCTLGLVNLFFVDEQKANMLKLQALEDGQEFEFEVEIDNAINPGLTTVFVRGPDVDGVLASITAQIASYGCSIVKLDAGFRGGDSVADTSLQNLLSQTPATVLEDKFIIRDRATGRAVDNDDLDDLARVILAAAKDPLNTHSLKGQIESLEIENMALAERVLMLQNHLEDQQIKIIKDGDDKGKE